MNMFAKKSTSGALLLPFFLVCFIYAPLSAQQNFTPIIEGEYTTIEDKSIPSSNITVSGSYRASAMQRRSGSLMGDKEGSNTQQEIKLSVKSVVNEHISVNGTLRNLFADTKTQQTAHATTQNDQENRSDEDNGLDATFESAFLEYNHNPHAILRVGQQEVHVGDRMGLIYKDYTNAITQDCRMGTWCTYIGGASIGDYERLYWFQLDYPVYENGVTINDLWGDTPERPESSFNVELYRISYGGNDSALGEYGGPTTANSTYQVENASEKVYFDTTDMEYYGLNFDFNYYSFELDANIITMLGKRTYHTGSQATTAPQVLSHQNMTGTLFRLNPRYQISKNWKIEYEGLTSTGTEKTSSSENHWDNNSTTFYEIDKGAFGNALIYFKGVGELGERHSVSNLTYHSVGATYRGSNRDRGFDLRYFTFSRTNAVYNQSGHKVTDIGQEIDLLLKWKIDKNLWVDLYWAMFQAGEAYSESDNIKPVAAPENFNTMGANLRYTF